MDTTIIVNGTAFTGEMILDAVAWTAGVFDFEIGSIWYPHQLVTSQEYDSIKKEMRDRHLDFVDKWGPSPCYSVWETNLGGWRFLYIADGHGDWHSKCFSF